MVMPILYKINLKAALKDTCRAFISKKQQSNTAVKRSSKDMILII